MTRLKSIVNTALMALVLAGAAAYAAAPAALRDYRSLAITAAGDRVAALESMDPGGLPKRPHATVVVRSLAAGKILNEYDPCKSCNYDHPAWSPNQQSLAFIGADDKAGTATLYVATQSTIISVATLKGIANTARWSPDGKQLALLATIGAKKLSGAVEAGARQIGEIGTEEDEQRIALVLADGGALTPISPRGTFVYEYDWTPDGKGFVVISAQGSGDNNWWVATLGHVDAANGSLRTLAAPKMQMALPRVAPDGKSAAFIGGLMSDFGHVGGDVYTVPLAGGAPINATPGFAGSFNGVAWRGKQVLGTAMIGADHAVIAIDPAARTNRMLWSGPVSVSRYGRFVFSADGAIAASVQEDFEHAPRIMAGPVFRLAAITHDNDDFAPQVAASNINWQNDNYRMQGWLLAPRNAVAGKTHPLVVMVHGGPASAWTPRFISEGEQANPVIGELIRRGYFVFLPNPRGSYGQGAAFGSANVRDFGGGDWRDILAGVDAVEKAAPIDGKRLGLMGHSYGGFMAMWGVTHSQRFKAAAAGGAIANWISYYGQNGIQQWMIPFFGASAYDDPAIYRAASPIESIKAAKTPTLIYVGERDVETPSAQSIEFWHGLRAMGTPTSLVIYEGEGHALRKPENQRDIRARIGGWFDRYLQ